MTEDLANIEATRFALQDLKQEREKWLRIRNQLDIHYVRNPDALDEIGYAGYQEINGWIDYVNGMEKQLSTHLVSMGGR